MKRTFLLAALIFTIAVAFNFDSQKAVSQSSAKGTIKVCVAPWCTVSIPDTKIRLLFGGTEVGNCTIPLGTQCCSMTGDFQTGDYIIDYTQDGINWCSYGIHYINGQNSEYDVICYCGSYK